MNQILAQKLARIDALQPRDGTCGLVEYVHRVSPHLDAPHHLAPLAEAFEKASREPLRLVVNTPPQHGKSTLAFHFLAWMLVQAPRRIMYLTYSEDFAAAQMAEARPIVRDAGVEFDSLASRSYRSWRTTDGGTLYATGIGGAITGRPGGVVIIDDPIKDWASAQSLAVREYTDNWLKTSVLTRMHPGSSVIVVQTRWHVDDISGRLEDRGWQVVNLPAISDDGKALWPDRRPLAWLEEQRTQMGDLLFSALYQGRPRPKGGEIFSSPSYCQMADVPVRGRAAIGIDLSYTAKTSSDYSVSLLMNRDESGKCFIADVVRKQSRAEDFGPSIVSHARRFPGSPVTWYCSGVELGSAGFLKKEGVPLTAKLATVDKFVRAQPVAAAWNRGDILVPADAPWAEAFVREVCAFTGNKDPNDDQVDALAAAYDSLGSALTYNIETFDRGTGRRSLKALNRHY